METTPKCGTLRKGVESPEKADFLLIPGAGVEPTQHLKTYY